MNGSTDHAQAHIILPLTHVTLNTTIHFNPLFEYFINISCTP